MEGGRWVRARFLATLDQLLPVGLWWWVGLGPLSAVTRTDISGTIATHANRRERQWGAGKDWRDDLVQAPSQISNSHQYCVPLTLHTIVVKVTLDIRTFWFCLPPPCFVLKQVSLCTPGWPLTLECWDYMYALKCFSKNMFDMDGFSMQGFSV